MRVQFGLFGFDTVTGALEREGLPVHLPPQPARLLAALVERPNDIVTRDDLRRRLWADGTAVDFERGLNFCVAQVRSALKENADSPSFIETLPRRGYRFIAPVRILDDDTVAVARDEVAPPATRASFSRATVTAAVAALALLATGVALVYPWRPTAGPIVVAVVPFDNQTGDAGFDDIAVGIADATVARLATPARRDAVRVIGNAAALHRPRSFRDLEAIGRELDADYVVLAQMAADAAGVRLIAHLIRTDDQTHVWAQTFDHRSFTLPIQAEIAETIAAAVTERLADPTAVPAKRSSPAGASH